MTNEAIRDDQDGRRYRDRLIAFVATKFVVLTLIGLYIYFYMV